MIQQFAAEMEAREQPIEAGPVTNQNIVHCYVDRWNTSSSCNKYHLSPNNLNCVTFFWFVFPCFWNLQPTKKNTVREALPQQEFDEEDPDAADGGEVGDEWDEAGEDGEEPCHAEGEEDEPCNEEGEDACEGEEPYAEEGEECAEEENVENGEGMEVEEMDDMGEPPHDPAPEVSHEAVLSESTSVATTAMDSGSEVVEVPDTLNLCDVPDNQLGLEEYQECMYPRGPSEDSAHGGASVTGPLRKAGHLQPEDLAVLDQALPSEGSVLLLVKCFCQLVSQVSSCFLATVFVVRCTGGPESEVEKEIQAIVDELTRPGCLINNSVIIISLQSQAGRESQSKRSCCFARIGGGAHPQKDKHGLYHTSYISILYFL